MKNCCDCAEDMIANMLTEDTGSHMMDSGGAGGRMWQQHARAMGDRSATDYLSSEPFVQLDRDGLLVISTYHHLTDTLEVTATSRELDAELAAFMADSTDYYLADMENWVQGMIDSGRVDEHEMYWAELTYNECAPVSQDFQHLGFTYEDEYYHECRHP